MNRPNSPLDSPDLTLYPYTRKILEVLEVLDTEQPTIETHRMDSLMHVPIDDTKALVHHALSGPSIGAAFQTTDSTPSAIQVPSLESFRLLLDADE